MEGNPDPVGLVGLVDRVKPRFPNGLQQLLAAAVTTMPTRKLGRAEAETVEAGAEANKDFYRVLELLWDGGELREWEWKENSQYSAFIVQ